MQVLATHAGFVIYCETLKELKDFHSVMGRYIEGAEAGKKTAPFLFSNSVVATQPIIDRVRRIMKNNHLPTYGDIDVSEWGDEDY